MTSWLRGFVASWLLLALGQPLDPSIPRSLDPFFLRRICDNHCPCECPEPPPPTDCADCPWPCTDPYVAIFLRDLFNERDYAVARLNFWHACSDDLHGPGRPSYCDLDEDEDMDLADLAVMQNGGRAEATKPRSHEATEEENRP